MIYVNIDVETTRYYTINYIRNHTYYSSNKAIENHPKYPHVNPIIFLSISLSLSLSPYISFSMFLSLFSSILFYISLCVCVGGGGGGGLGWEVGVFYNGFVYCLFMWRLFKKEHYSWIF